MACSLFLLLLAFNIALLFNEFLCSLLFPLLSLFDLLVDLLLPIGHQHLAKLLLLLLQVALNLVVFGLLVRLAHHLLLNLFRRLRRHRFCCTGSVLLRRLFPGALLSFGDLGTIVILII